MGIVSAGMHDADGLTIIGGSFFGSKGQTGSFHHRKPIHIGP